MRALWDAINLGGEIKGIGRGQELTPGIFLKEGFLDVYIGKKR